MEDSELLVKEKSTAFSKFLAPPSTIPGGMIEPKMLGEGVKEMSAVFSMIGSSRSSDDGKQESVKPVKSPQRGNMCLLKTTS